MRNETKDQQIKRLQEIAIERGDELTKTERKLKIAVEALNELASFIEVQPTTGSFRNKAGNFVRFEKFAQAALKAIEEEGKV